MTKIGRNQPCPCGSGKKFKVCHGDSSRAAVPTEAAIDPERLVGTAVDHEAKQIIHVTNDVLTNQLRRDCPLIGESFDTLCDADIAEISELVSRTLFLLLVGHRRAISTDDELQQTAAEISFNAVNTLMAAAALTRQGFYLQAPILVRSVLESVATIFHVIMHPGDLTRFRNSRLELKATLASAKAALPPFGGLYGFFSENFVHVSSLHGSLQPLVPYKERSDELDINILFLRMGAWLLYVATELLFIDVLRDDARYWRMIASNQAAYDPSVETRQWQDAFLMGVGKP